MNKQLKQHLEGVLTAVIEQDSTAAKQSFHDYLRLKSQHLLMGESAEEDDADEADDKKSEDDDKSDDADSKKDDKKDEKKDDKDDEKKDDKDM